MKSKGMEEVEYGREEWGGKWYKEETGRGRFSVALKRCGNKTGNMGIFLQLFKSSVSQKHIRRLSEWATARCMREDYTHLHFPLRGGGVVKKSKEKHVTADGLIKTGVSSNRCMSFSNSQFTDYLPRSRKWTFIHSYFRFPSKINVKLCLSKRESNKMTIFHKKSKNNQHKPRQSSLLLHFRAAVLNIGIRQPQWDARQVWAKRKAKTKETQCVFSLVTESHIWPLLHYFHSLWEKAFENLF